MNKMPMYMSALFGALALNGYSRVKRSKHAGGRFLKDNHYEARRARRLAQKHARKRNRGV